MNAQLQTQPPSQAHQAPSFAFAPTRSRLLQRKCACGDAPGTGGECEACRKTRLQRKLAIGLSNDPLELEADRVAEQILATPTDAAISGASLSIQRDTGQPTEHLEEVPASVDRVLGSPGRPLGPPLQQDMEQRFGHDFSRVRVHSGATAEQSAREVNANAYTVGHNMVFGAGRFAPWTREGRSLIAHELTHVVQQSGGGLSPESENIVRRQAADGVLVGHTPAPAAGAAPVQQAPPDGLGQQIAPPGTLTEPAPQAGEAAEGGVQRLVFSCADKRLRMETGSGTTIYTLERCSLPNGAYEAEVTIEGNDFSLKFPDSVSSDQRFDFSYRVQPGQKNPAVLLADQPSIHVDVVEHLPPPSQPQPAPPATADGECIIHLKDRQLVPPGSASRALFKTRSFEQTIWSQPIPLGEFGFIQVNANASGSLSGTMSGSYGPGMLTDICLTHAIGGTAASAPIKSSQLDPGSHADVSTFSIGGRARFRLPASAHAGIVARGKLVLSGDFLDLIEVAAIEGGLTARGDASLSGSLDAMVDIVARFTRASATLGLFPLGVVITQSSLDKLDLAAKVALQGHASLALGLDATAAVRLAGFELWRETWRLRNEAGIGLGWAAGLNYSPNPGIHWVLGAIGKLEGIDDLLSDDDDEDAQIEEDDVLDTLLNQASGHVAAPDGLSKKTALPFTWHKPIEIYPRPLPIPNAEDPKTLDRDDGPTAVRFLQNGRSVSDRIGVASRNWPFQGKFLQYLPHEAREEQNRLRALLSRLGYDRAGTDVDHVHELQFGGTDTFGNLWPADNSANRSAGRRHTTQLENYRQQLGNIEGRHFVIARIGI